MTEVIGVTFPIPKSYMDRFFTEGKTVFIKPAACYKEIQPGMKLVFYQSHEDTGFVGEAEITSIAFDEDPMVFSDRYGEQLFLTENEISMYLNDTKKWRRVHVRRNPQKKRMWMALELKNIRRYDEIIKPPQFVAVGGQYLKE